MFISFSLMHELDKALKDTDNVSKTRPNLAAERAIRSTIDD